MAIVRLTHDGYGMLETNRIDRSYNEAQCSLDTTAFPNVQSLLLISLLAQLKSLVP